MIIKTKTYITIGLFLLSVILLIVFAVIPLYNGITKDATEYVATQNQIASLNAQVSNINDLKSQYQEYQPNLDKINQLFINAEVPIDFIKFLEQLASDCGVSVNISPASGPVKGGQQNWQYLDMDLSISGASFTNFSKFLEKLENAPYLINVNNLNIQADGQNIDASLTIRVFAN